MLSDEQYGEINKLIGQTKSKYSRNRAKERLRDLAKRYRDSGDINNDEYKAMISMSGNQMAALRRKRAGASLSLGEGERLYNTTGDNLVAVRETTVSQPDSPYLPPPIVWTGTEDQWRERTGQMVGDTKTTRQQRALEAAEQTRIRMAFPNQTRRIPVSQKITISTPKETGTYSASRTKGNYFENLFRSGDYDIQTAAKNRMQGKTGVFYEARGQAKQFIADYGLGFTEAAKDPKNAATLVGVTLLTKNPKYGKYAMGALELYAPFYATGELKAIGEGKGVGRSAGELSFFAAGGYGLGYVGQKYGVYDKPVFTVEEAGVKRTSYDDFTLDVINFETKASIGKDVIGYKGKASVEMPRINEDTYGLKGEGIFKQIGGKSEESFNTRGWLKGNPGEWTSTSITKTSSNKYFLDITQSKTLIEEPYTSFKTLSGSTRVPKGKTIYQSVPKQISTGVTGELYVEDVFSGKNIFRKDINTESGDFIGQEVYFGSNRIGADANTFNKEFTGFRSVDYSKIMENRADFAGSGGNLITAQVTSKLPSSSGLVLEVGRQKTLNLAQKVRGEQVSKTSLASKSINTKSQSQFNLNKIADVTLGTSSKSVSKTYSSFAKGTSKTIIQTKSYSVSRSKPRMNLFEGFSMKMDTKPVFDTKPISILQVDTKPALDTKSSQVTTQVFKGPMFNIKGGKFKNPFTPLPPPPIPKLGKLKLNLSIHKSTRRGSKQAKKYTPSFAASLLDISVSRKQAKRMGLNKKLFTGLEFRPKVRGL